MTQDDFVESVIALISPGAEFDSVTYDEARQLVFAALRGLEALWDLAALVHPAIAACPNLEPGRPRMLNCIGGNHASL